MTDITQASTPQDFDIPKQYVDEQGRIIHWPRRKNRNYQLNILRYLLTKFELDRVYTEREFNDILKAYHTFEDWAMLRREMYVMGWINREKNGANYERVARTVEDMQPKHRGGEW